MVTWHGADNVLGMDFFFYVNLKVKTLILVLEVFIISFHF